MNQNEQKEKQLISDHDKLTNEAVEEICIILKDLFWISVDNDGYFVNSHEAYGALKEVFDNVWLEIKHRNKHTDNHGIVFEAEKLAAILIKFLVTLKSNII
jgi:hypothetical protein